MAYSYIYEMCRICNIQLPWWNANSVDKDQTSYGGRSTTNKRDVSTGVLKAHIVHMSKQNIDTDQLASYSLLFQCYRWNEKKSCEYEAR